MLSEKDGRALPIALKCSAVNLADLNTFAVQTKPLVLWSPVLTLSIASETFAAAEVGNKSIRFSAGNTEIVRLDSVEAAGPPRVRLGRASLRFSRREWRVVDPSSSNVLATIRGLTSTTQAGWNIELHGGRDCVVEEKTSLFGRLMDRKWLKSFTVSADNSEIGNIRERLYPFGQKLTADFSSDFNHILDRRVAIAMASIILLSLSQSIASPTV